MKTILLITLLTLLAPLAQASIETSAAPQNKYLLSCTNNPDGTLNCKNLETQVVATVSATPSVGGTTTVNYSSNTKSSTSTGEAVGMVVGILLFLLFVVYCVSDSSYDRSGPCR